MVAFERVCCCNHLVEAQELCRANFGNPSSLKVGPELVDLVGKVSETFPFGKGLVFGLDILVPHLLDVFCRMERETTSFSEKPAKFSVVAQQSC